MDFTAWFFSKHWLLAAFLQPELALIWAIYMRWSAWSVILGLWVAIGRALKIWESWRNR